jgi:O-antigen/teichoic acid export membrane protein
MASGFVNQLVQPILFARVGDARDDMRVRRTHAIINRLLVGSILLTLAGASVAAVGSRYLFRHLLPPAYGSAAPLLPVIALAAGIFASGQIASLKHTLSTTPRTLIAPKIATAVFGASLNLAGAYVFGITGVAVAGLCFSVAYCVWVVATAPLAAKSNATRTAA